MRSKEQVNEEHGVPFAGNDGLARIKGRSVRALSNVPTFGAEASGAILSEHSKEELSRASRVLARAFIDDPLFRKWPGICTIENREEKIATLEQLFSVLVRGASPLNHTFIVSNAS